MIKHPFADLIGLRILQVQDNQSICSLTVKDELFNPHDVIHGGVLYSMADTGMGSALYPALQAGEICATIDIKINYFKPVLKGEILCKSTVVNRGKSIANVEAEISVDDRLVDKANGNFAIYRHPAGNRD